MAAKSSHPGHQTPVFMQMVRRSLVTTNLTYHRHPCHHLPDHRHPFQHQPRGRKCRTWMRSLIMMKTLFH